MTDPGTRGAVLVTGASTGIGRACALALDGLGHPVFAGVRREADAESLRREASGRLAPVLLDVTDAAAIEAAAKTVETGTGARGLAGLVNNAGINAAAPVEFLELDALRRALEVNLVGPVAVTQALLPALRRARGRIVNVSSIGGRVANPLLGPYCASKFALEAISDSLRQELRPWGLHVALVEPGGVDTPIFEKGLSEADALAGRLPPHALELYGPQIEAVRGFAHKAAKRAIPPARVAEVVIHALTAARPRTRYLVGTDARMQAVLASVLPDRARDAVVARFLGLPRRAG